jgi:hypothetical protein
LPARFYEEDFEQSEWKNSLDDWMLDIEIWNGLDVLPLHEGSSHEVKYETAVKSIDEFLELLLELSSTQHRSFQ